jgi:uncharacterized protein YjbJ (UPF0337 family)
MPHGTEAALRLQGGDAMNRDEVEGKAEAMKGKAKQTVGRMANDPELESEGAADEAAGQTKDAIGRGRRKAGEFIEEVGKQLKK